jgi:phosphatidylglycerol lysyltransferase
MKLTLRIVRPLILLVIFAGAGWLLYNLLKDLHFQELVDDLEAVRASQILVAIGLTALNYLILMGYDWLAIRYIGHPLPFGKLAVASFIGHVSSFNFGGLAGGSSMRYRIYSAWKFSMIEIVQLVAILGLTFWLGVIALAGIIFVVTPFPIPDSVLDPRLVPEWARQWLAAYGLRCLGVILLAHVAVYLGICAVRRKPLQIWHWHVPLPPPSLSIAQIGVSCADLMVAAGVFYMVLPPSLAASVTYPDLLGMFLLALVVQVALHVPGGIGVFDGIMVGFFLNQKEGMAAALLVFRGVYYLLPLAAAGIVWLVLEITLGRQFLREVSEKVKAAQAAGHGLPSGPAAPELQASDCPQCSHDKDR